MANDTETAKTPTIPEPPMVQELMLGRNVSPVLQILLNDKLFDRVRVMAGYMAKAAGVMPKHLIGKSEACFAVICRAMTWRLDPFAVAQCTYQTPGGSIGYEGKLIAGIIENSGRIEGAVKYTHYGRVSVTMADKTVQHFRSTEREKIEAAVANGGKITATKSWESLNGKYTIVTGESGGQYPKASWTNPDAEGLGVIVSAKVKGEAEPREWPFDLIQAFPRNSPLWATDPRSQICYTATRRFANLAMPGVLMGVPFDREEDETAFMVDVTPPRPTRDSFETGESVQTAQPETELPAKPEPVTTYTVLDLDHAPTDFADAVEAVRALTHLLSVAAKQGEQQFLGLWEGNTHLPGALRDAGHAPLADALHETYTKTIAGFDAAKAKAKAEANAKAAEAKPAETKAPTAQPSAAAQPEVLTTEPPTPIKGVKGAKHDPKAPLAARVIWIKQKMALMTPIERAEFLATDPEIEYLQNTLHWPALEKYAEELTKAARDG